MKYKDIFLGEIELTKLSEKNNHWLGYSQIEEIYTYESGSYYIRTVYDDGTDSMMVIPKPLLEELIRLEKREQ